MDKNSVFLYRLKKIFFNDYDYSLVDYINNYTKVKLICKIHGDFEKHPKHLLNGSGCQQCSKMSQSIKKRKPKDIFINELKNIFGDIYDFSYINYQNTESKVKLICKIHGEFEKYPKHLLNGSGCQQCSKENANKKQKFNNHKVINSFIKKHGNKYDYSLVDYINTYTPVKIICEKHGIFEQIPRDHKRGYNCPKCNISKGENKIKNFLENNNILYEEQKIFTDCKFIKPLKFDFYLPYYNTCIEFNGLQHYKPVSYFGGEKEFNKNKKRDKIKSEYCYNNKIKLIKIPYNHIYKISEYLNF